MLRSNTNNDSVEGPYANEVGTIWCVMSYSLMQREVTYCDRICYHCIVALL